MNTTGLSAEALRELKGKAEKATKGPWAADDGGDFRIATVAAVGGVRVGPIFESTYLVSYDLHSSVGDDSAYIAAASPDVILALLAERERLLVSLDECHTLAIGWAAHYAHSHGLCDWCDTHKQIIARAEQALAAAGEE